MPVVVHGQVQACVPVMSSNKFQQGNSGSASFRFIDRVVVSLWTETGTFGKIVEIPQLHLLDKFYMLVVFTDRCWVVQSAETCPGPAVAVF